MGNPKRTVPPRARAHILANPRQPAKQAATELGVSTATLKTYRCWLVGQGALKRTVAVADLDAVQEALEDGLLLREVSARMGRRLDFVQKAIARRGLRAEDLRGEHVYTVPQVAAMLGRRDIDGGSAYAWAKQIGLPMRTIPGRRRTHYRITATALQEFLELPQCPIDPARIADPDWRAYAVAARAGHLRPPLPAPPPEARCPVCGRSVSRHGRMCVGCARTHR